MEVQNFECQIAQSQMSRYLAGESFSAEAVKQLNEHIAHCVNCKAVLAQRRSALQDQLSKPTRQVSAPTTKAVVQQPEETVTVSEAEPPKVSFTKPLLLSTALAVVLIGMTVISRDPTTLFGQRASQASAITPPTPGASSTAKPRWSGSALAASLNRAFSAASKHLQASQGLAPAQVPLTNIKPLNTVAAKGAKIGGQIGDVGSNGYPAVTVYPPAGQKPPVATSSHTEPKKAPQRVSRRKSTPKPSQPERPAIAIYDSAGNPISK